MKMKEQKRTGWADWADHLRSLDDPANASEKPEALDDLVVLDLSSRSMAGCFCSSLLAELGAKTIRIEPPGGDLVRTYSLAELKSGYRSCLPPGGEKQVSCHP